MITRLHVRNFKSLRDLDVHLSPVNVLAGPNMSGKSNIIDVFRFVYEIIFPQSGTVGTLYALAQRGGIEEVVWKGGDEKLLTILLEGGEYSNASRQFRYELKLLTGAGGFVSIQDESLDVSQDGLVSRLIIREQGATQIRNLDGKVLGGIPAEGSSLQYAPPNWDGYAFSQWIKLWRFYHLAPPLMRQASLMALGQVLSTSGENLSAWLMWLQAHSINRLSE